MQTKTKYSKKADSLADKVITQEDRVKRWKHIHDLLRTQNKKARKEQDQVAKECAEIRAEKIYSKKKTKTMGLRFGVAMPPTTYNALVKADELIYGKSDLASPDKEAYLDLKATNQVVKDLGRAFPQYKVS